ncbi:MAG: hypothetical protein ACRELB_22155, partial [Polyangiaceae bacterium]
MPPGRPAQAAKETRRRVPRGPWCSSNERDATGNGPAVAGTDLAHGPGSTMLRPSRIRFALVLTGVLLATLSFSPPSFAGDAAVEALIDTGIDRYKRHDYDGARVMFSQAYQADPSQVGTLFNLALAELQSGHPVDAARHLRTFVASPQAQPERVESARSKWLPEAEAEVGRLSIEAPAGTAVSVDGAPLGQAPFGDPIYVAAGQHDLVAKLGSGERSMHVNAVAGKVISVQFVPDENATTPAPVSLPPAPAAAIENPASPDEAAPSPGHGAPPAKIVTVAVLCGMAVAAAGVAIG